MAKRRTAAQKRATRKMIAANRARARTRRAPARSTRRRRRRNPTPLAAKRRAYTRAIRIGNPVRRRRRARRRSNPLRMGGVVNTLVMPSVVGAGGALLVDLVLGYVPLPTSIASNKWARAGVKGLAAVGLALAADKTKLVSRRTAQQLGIGSLTVTLAGIGRDLIGQVAPDVKLDGLGYYTSALPAGVPSPLSNSLGVYVGGGRRQLPSATRAVGATPAPGMGAYTSSENSEGGYTYY